MPKKPYRRGPGGVEDAAIDVAIILKTGAKKPKKKSGSPKPNNPSLYSRVKAEAKRKFKVYPSAYANAWLVKTYKKRGGTYSGKKPS